MATGPEWEGFVAVVGCKEATANCCCRERLHRAATVCGSGAGG